MLNTKIDQAIDIISQKKKVTLSVLSKSINWEPNSLERVLLILENANLVELHYPSTLIQAPFATLPKKSPLSSQSSQASPLSIEQALQKSSSSDEPSVEQYMIDSASAHVRAKVEIKSTIGDKRPSYHLTLEQVSPYTRSYLEYVKVEVAATIPVSGLESSKEDAAKLYSLRLDSIAKLIKADLASNEEEISSLCNVVLNEMYGLGKIEALIGDERLEEIVINSSKQPVSVYHRKHGWLKTDVILKSEAEIENYSEQIARKVGRQISVLNPILDAHLSTGDRVNATLYPISSAGNTITLRLFARNPWTVVSYLKPNNNSMSYEMVALLWQAMQYEMNIIIAGGTASGKTSALNGLLALIQPFQRIVTIEDTREIVLPSFQWNWVPLVTRQPNPEGAGEVTMLDLVVNALRMRPDRIVMGEIRRKKEAEVLFEAMHTGHSVYATIHADTGSQVIKRLVEPPIELPAAEVEDVHLLLVQYRDRRRNLRRTLELSEVLPGEGTPELNRLYTWKARNDTFQAVKAPRRYVEQLNLHTGMTEKEMTQDQIDKTTILKWMVENNLDQVEPVGKVMNIYYANPNIILEAAQKKLSPDKVL